MITKGRCTGHNNVSSRRVLLALLLIIFSSAILFAQEQADASRNNDTDRYTANISADPVGFLTLGPSVELEIALSKFMGIFAGARIPSLGLLVRSLYSSMTSSWTAAFGAKFYFGTQQHARGFYIAPRIEYGKSNYEYESSSIDRATYQVMAIGLQIGKKWIGDTGITVDVSDSIGVILNNREYPDIPEVDWRYDMFVYYMLSIKFGFAF